jgi:hypothetical protein
LESWSYGFLIFEFVNFLCKRKFVEKLKLPGDPRGSIFNETQHRTVPSATRGHLPQSAAMCSAACRHGAPTGTCARKPQVASAPHLKTSPTLIFCHFLLPLSFTACAPSSIIALSWAPCAPPGLNTAGAYPLHAILSRTAEALPPVTPCDKTQVSHQDHVKGFLIKQKYTSAHTYKLNINELIIQILQIQVSNSIQEGSCNGY